MQRYFMHLAYNGAPFHGWQSQPNAVSVQQTIETALSTVLRAKISIVGAGRTDTGVNARCMVAHFDCETAVIDIDRLVRAVNTLVGNDIAVYSITPVHADAHARFDAMSRSYRYFVTHRKSPFFYPFSWYSPNRLDYDAMNRAAAILTQVDDFTSFAKLHSDTKTNICRVSRAQWFFDKDKQQGYFEITADRFLRNMVRAVVGTLVDVGRGKLDIDGFYRIIEARDRCSAGTSMPPQALFLWNVTYPYYIPKY